MSSGNHKSSGSYVRAHHGASRRFGSRPRRAFAHLPVGPLCHPGLRAHYSDNGNGTVTDPSSGLTWMRCAIGQAWAGSTCTGAATAHSWTQANALTGTVTLLDQNDWRLASIRELQSIDGSNRRLRRLMPRHFRGRRQLPALVCYRGPDVRFHGDDPCLVCHLWKWLCRQRGQSSTFQARLVRGGQASGSLLNPARPAARPRRSG